MGLSNASKMARNYSQTVNQNQGGGSKKAGFPYQIGRNAWSNVYLDSNTKGGNCCKLGSYMTMKFTPTTNHLRPTGGNVGIARGYYGKF
jgi:hypothetical protein